ncbi:hypothetical protein DFH07DRAFT_784251 [Mycena maculata]|uniref:Uncharacterized protein n=1 Tax=Mycena maculata TaxID=230809 RepID=A0AAD7HIU8_9AGAR|nr:hypothetical protein DFH07DRAFT_784251 [Mycena maculata]
MFYRRGLPNWAEYKCAGAPSKSEFAHRCFIDEVFLIGPSTNDVLLTWIEGVVAPSKDERLRRCLCRELFQIRTKTNALAMQGMASPHTDVFASRFSGSFGIMNLSLQKHSKIIRLGCWLWPVAAGEICPGGNAVTHNVQTGVGLRPAKNYPIPIILIMGRAGDKYCAKDGRKSATRLSCSSHVQLLIYANRVQSRRTGKWRLEPNVTARRGGSGGGGEERLEFDARRAVKKCP